MPRSPLRRARPTAHVPLPALVAVVALWPAAVYPTVPAVAQSSAAGAEDGRPGVAWVTGRVVEAGSGDPVAGAEVRLSGPAEREGVSTAEGRWRIGPLPRGRYELHVSHLGFAPAERVVEVGGEAAVEIALTPRPIAMDAMVVTAGRRLQRLADTPVPTQLISTREIRETGSTDLASVLTEKAGIELQGGHPAGAGVMIQGMGSERVLVLLDGQPFIGRISGTVDVSRIPTSMIDRVEVVKGPQSTLYGSEAMGGVVNVITRGPDRSTWSAGASATAGDQGRVDLSASGVGGAGPVTAVGDLGRRTIRVAPGQAGAGDALSDRWDGLAKLTWDTPVDGVRLQTGGVLLDERQRWRNGQLFHFADNRQWSGRVGAAWESGAHRLSPTLFVTRFDHLARKGTAETPVPGTGETESQRLTKAELLYGVGSGGHSVDAGVEARRDAIRSDRVAGGGRTEDVVEAFVQATLAWDNISLVPGVRASWSDTWGSHITPRMAALFRPLPELALRVSGGSGFRAPAFKELYMEFLNIGPGFGYTVRGNAHLAPEVSRNATASVEWSGDRTYVRVEAFDNRFRDFIETRPVGDSSGITVYTYGNVDDGFTRGVELEAGVTWGGLRLEGGYGLLAAERVGTGEPLLGRPARSARGSVAYAHAGGLRAAVTGVYTGRTPMRITDAGTEWRDGFLRFDLRLAHSLPAGLELVAGVDNLFDQQSTAWPGFTGRHVYTGVSWRAAGNR